MRDPKRIARIVRIRQRQEEMARAAWQRAELEARAAAERADAQADSVRTSLQAVRDLQLARTPGEVLQAHWALDGMQANLRAKQAEARYGAQVAQARMEPWIERRRTLLAMEKWKERADQERRQWRIQREEKAMESTLEANLARKSCNQTNL
ncbi:MAG: hypothetical protein H6830_09615 [Planctomycetes bacterium]|nr:hypothetical protein [Planctomycetota bacterium]MCB9909982.1 hypothetical protein [Planctomycetota bacterium]HPF12716.1 hypothetical protein [Planctomycetota bacterium]HRV81808.1 hypothetical protein [Planctomycetota bacterium]